MVPMASSSDCQFCSVLLQKSGATRYSPRRERVEPVAQPLLVVRHPAGDRLRRPRQHEDGGHREDERVRVQPGAPAADPGPGGRVGRRVLADELLLVGLPALVTGLLRLRRAALHEPHRERDVEHELEELRLPVLGDVDGEPRRRHVPPERDLLQLSGPGLLVVEGDSPHRLGGQGQQEQPAEDERQRVVAPEGARGRGAAHRRLSPMARQNARPTAMKPAYSQKTTLIGSVPLHRAVVGDGRVRGLATAPRGGDAPPVVEEGEEDGVARVPHLGRVPRDRDRRRLTARRDARSRQRLGDSSRRPSRRTPASTARGARRRPTGRRRRMP